MEKIKYIKNKLKYHNIDGYIIPKNDEFFNEYVSPENDNLKYISNFSGSYGFALILKNKNFLFVDGRYIIQAGKESGKNFKILNLFDQSPSKVLKNNYKIGFNPKIFTRHMLNRLFNTRKTHLIPINENIVKKKIKTSNSKKKKIFSIDEKYCGKSYKKKIREQLNYLNKRNIDFKFISAPENIAWLLNVRGDDSPYIPMAFGRLLINRKGKVIFFIKTEKISKKILKKFKNIKFVDLENLNNVLINIKNKRIIIDKVNCSFFFESLLAKKNRILKEVDNIYQLKSIKNKTEIKNIKRIHVYDGVALTKFLIWVKKNYKKKNLTELSASKKLLSLRKKNHFFRSLSFPTISATGPNGAIIHYNPNFKTNRKLKKGDIFLIDSGGQYLFGTTDVTRTISLDNNENKIKNIFTRVLKGHISVLNYKLNKKTKGYKVDQIARQYLKKINLDYPHGTGHGVGCYLNVHESPYGISKFNNSDFPQGIVISNEPGYYKKNYYGIRIENLITVIKSRGKLRFSNLTMAPIEKDLINKSLLNKLEIKTINQYHKEVFNKLNKHFSINEKKDLTRLCSYI